MSQRTVSQPDLIHTHARSFHDVVTMSAPDRGGYCSRCHKKLLVDVGIADDGVPGAWAYCRSCKTYYCPVNPRHVLKQGTARWKDGRTAHAPGKVANCLQGTCGNHFDRLESAAAVVMVSPRGGLAQERLAPLKELSSGADLWARQAQALIALCRFKTHVEPVWKADEAAAQRAAELAQEKRAAAARQAASLAEAQARVARREALSVAAGPAWKAYAAAGSAFVDSPQLSPSVAELLAMVRSG